METIKIIPADDYSEFESLVAEYLPGTSMESLRNMYTNFPSACVGYYIDGRLLGCCYGAGEADGHFALDGIAIVFPFNAHGKGGALLAFFEKQVAALGYKRISLGSAGGYVERFYLKNGYTAIELKILVPPGEDWQKSRVGMRTRWLLCSSKESTQSW